MDQIDMMRVFIRAAETRSFRRAAEQSHLSKTQVCRAIATLEARLETRLLTRTTRKMSLTGAGLRYLEGCREFLEKLDQLDDSISRAGSKPSGTLNVLATETLPPKTLIGILDGYRRRCPDVKVKVVPGENLSQLVDNRHDVALLSGSTRPSLGGELETVCLSFPIQQLVPCVSPSYLANHVEPTEPDQLSGHMCICAGDKASEPVWTFADKQANTLAVPIVPAYAVNSAHHVRLAALAGIGIAVLPESLAAYDIANGALKRILRDYTVESRDPATLLVYPRRRFMNQRLRAFVDNVIELAEAAH